MKKIIVFGAGQAGQMVLRWLNSNLEILAFADNNNKKHGSQVFGYPVISAEAAVKKKPDIIYIAILNQEACFSIRKQLLEIGFEGEIRDLFKIRDVFDFRLAFLKLIAEEIKKTNLKGDIAELGVYKGDFARELNSEFPERSLHLFDTFTGFDNRDLSIEKSKVPSPVLQNFSNTSIDLVKKKMLFPDKVKFYPGRFPDTIPLDDLSFSLVSLDTDLYQPTYEGLKYFYPRLEKGGSILVHDYNSFQYPGVKKAVCEFCDANNIMVLPLMDLHGTAVIQR